jgi:HD-GYP domain-containing protein (c-di-GMP phosphodiesterase class II)
MKRVGIVAKAMAVSMGLPKKYGDDLRLFAPMHDIGKVGILDSILRAERSLTEATMREMVSKRGSHFDPAVIDSFVTIGGAVEKICSRLADP